MRNGHFGAGRVAYALAAIAAVAALSFVLIGRAPRAEATVSGKRGLKARYDQFAGGDDVTAAVRDRSRELVRVEISSAADREKAASVGRIVQDLGVYVLVSVKKGSRELASAGPAIQRVETSISLPGRRFDPLAEPSGISWKSREGLSGGKRYFVVQFAGNATDDWLDSVRDAGGEILQYVPNQAFFVYADDAAAARIAGHSRVRWIGEYAAEDRIPDVLRSQISNKLDNTGLSRSISPLEMTRGGAAVFDVAVFARADINEVAGELLATTGGTIRNLINLPNNYFNIIRVEVPIASVDSVASIPDVVRIDAWSTPTAEDEKAAQIVAGNYTGPTSISGPGYDPFTQFGVNGSNVTVSVVDDGVAIPGDGGFYLTAANSVDGPLRGSTAGAQGHGHLNASIIAGDSPFSGVDAQGYNYGLGIARKSNIINIPFLRAGYTGAEADCYNDTVATAGPNGVLGSISNNSWGSGTNSNQYDSYAAQFDGFARDASTGPSIDPVLLVFSAGNSGASGLTRPKVAKNLIAVASSENLRGNLDSGADSIEDISSFSSRGLASDGRVKPDIAAPGQAITGGRAGADALFGNIDAAHRWSSGTSHAAPQVAGAAALFTQFWKAGNGGANPSPALTKAAILLSGQEMMGVGATTPLPNGGEGWGRVNMKYMMDANSSFLRVNQSRALSNVGETYSVTGSVASSVKPTRVALVWTDPPAVASPALLNNLDLSVSVNGVTYKGNVFSGGSSAAGGSFDTLNNVENVWLPAGIPAGAQFTITVTATALNGDGILGNADTTDQHFGLVAYNFTQSAPVQFFSVSGRAVSQSGIGVSGAYITLTDPSNAIRLARTNLFGFYSFANVQGGQSYTVRAASKRYAFNSEVSVLVGTNVTNLNFIAN